MFVVNRGTLCPGNRVTGGCETCHVGPGNRPAPSQTMNQIKYSSARVLCALNYL